MNKVRRFLFKSFQKYMSFPKENEVIEHVAFFVCKIVIMQFAGPFVWYSRYQSIQFSKGRLTSFSAEKILNPKKNCHFYPEGL